MLKFLRSIVLLLIGLVIVCLGLALVFTNTEFVDFNLLNIGTLNLPLGALVIGALAIGIVFGLLLDELANFLSSRVRKSKVKKLEAQLQKLSSE